MIGLQDLPGNDYIWEKTREGLGILDTSGVIHAANPALCAFLGYTSSELVGKNFRDITASVDVAADAEAFTRLVNGEIDSYEQNKLYLPKLDRAKPGRLRAQRIPGGMILVLGQVLPLDAFEAANVPPDQRAQIVSLAVVDLLQLLFKNWKVVATIIAIALGANLDSLVKLFAALSGKPS